MVWIRAFDCEGHPAWFARFGRFAAYITGECRPAESTAAAGGSTMVWHYLSVYDGNQFADPEVMERYAEPPLFESSAPDEETPYLAEPAGSMSLAVFTVRNFIDAECAKLREEIATLETRRP